MDEHWLKMHVDVAVLSTPYLTKNNYYTQNQLFKTRC